MYIISYLLTNPLYISSITVSLNIPYTIYSNNNYLLLSQIPVATSSIIYHHNLYPIRNIDILCGQFAYWHHMYYCNNTISRNCWVLCPTIYIISRFYYNKKFYKTSNLFHAIMHYMLSIGTIYFNYSSSY